jgi:hypothetical protein
VHSLEFARELILNPSVLFFELRVEDDENVRQLSRDVARLGFSVTPAAAPGMIRCFRADHLPRKFTLR